MKTQFLKNELENITLFSDSFMLNSLKPTKDNYSHPIYTIPEYRRKSNCLSFFKNVIITLHKNVYSLE